MRTKLLSLVERSTGCLLVAALFMTEPVMGPSQVAAQMNPTQVSTFLSNPASLLASNPNGGDQLVNAVRDLILADPTTLNAIMNLASSANSDQQASIGSGLGLAAKALADTNPQLASQIQTAVAASGSQTLIASYSTASGNTVTAATPGGAGGGGGGGVGPTAGIFAVGGSSGGGGNTGGNTGTGTGVGTLTGGGYVSGSGSSSSLGGNVSPN